MPPWASGVIISIASVRVMVPFCVNLQVVFATRLTEWKPCLSASRKTSAWHIAFQTGDAKHIRLKDGVAHVLTHQHAVKELRHSPWYHQGHLSINQMQILLSRTHLYGSLDMTFNIEEDLLLELRGKYTAGAFLSFRDDRKRSPACLEKTKPAVTLILIERDGTRLMGRLRK